MELVPILSTIILVGTIATFILAVAAYILYKIREGRAQEKRTSVEQARQEPHVLVSPQQRPALSEQQVRREPDLYMTPGQTARQQQTAPGTQGAQRQSQQPQFEPRRRDQPGRDQSRQESLFWEYTDEGFVPVQPEESRDEDQRQEENENDDGYAWL